jgi:hypothetical protein
MSLLPRKTCGANTSVPNDLFDRDRIVSSLAEVAAILEETNSPSGVLVVVGGSYMALHDLRESTADVDTIKRIERSIREAVEIVAERRGFVPEWLNDKATPYWPQGLTLEACELLIEFPRLRVYGPPARFIFFMKLYAGRAPDHDDMVALWPNCSFESAQKAVNEFHAAYPHAADDPYLVEYVHSIAVEARGSSPPTLERG